MNRIRIFISSVQREFKEERAMLVSYLRGDALLGKFFDPFIFEELPAMESSAQQVYLEQVERCDIYLGLFGKEYGYTDAEGISPTEREYDKATECSKYRIVFKTKDSDRDEREAKLIAKAEAAVVRKTFADMDELRTVVYAALVRYLETREIIHYLPFDASKDTSATIADLDEDKIQDFIDTARRIRNFPLSVDSSPEKLLTHLDLIDDDGRLTNAAILLFGKKPQKYFITSEVKCIQFFGNKVERPLPAYQIYKGDVFELVDKATDFVMGRLNNWTGVRDKGPTASVETHPEIPMDVVKEAIVNAVCHRDYRSNASVQVMLFRNRLEVWNPGTLPFGLTIAKLYEAHKSIPANPLLAEPMFYKGYIDKAGTGTEHMVELCREYGLEDPKFQQDEDFRVVIFRPAVEDEEDTKDQAGTRSGTQSSSRDQVSAQVSDQVGTKSGIKSGTKSGTKLALSPEKLEKILRYCMNSEKIANMCHSLGYNDRTKFKKNYINPLLDAGLLEMTIPEKPTSSQQKYRTTEKGIQLLHEKQEGQHA